MHPSSWEGIYPNILMETLSVFKCLIVENFKPAENTEESKANLHVPPNQLRQLITFSQSCFFCTSVPIQDILRHMPGIMSYYL